MNVRFVVFREVAMRAVSIIYARAECVMLLLLLDLEQIAVAGSQWSRSSHVQDGLVQL